MNQTGHIIGKAKTVLVFGSEPKAIVSSVIARGARKIVLGVDFRDSGCNLRRLR